MRFPQVLLGMVGRVLRVVAVDRMDPLDRGVLDQRIAPCIAGARALAFEHAVEPSLFMG